jgi:predicted regulator of Ras-like GTPase activity (Roadblock/LC7/MglB family)
MTIPFLSYFKKARGNGAAKVKEAAPAPPPPLEKPSSERFSKTVMPNATRTLPPQDPFEMAARSTALGGQMPTAVMSAPIPAAPRTISFNAPTNVPPKRELPPAVALALEPTVERVISLELADVVAGMPPGHVKPLNEEDSQRRILLRASEVEKGMASGKPSVSLATIYDQVPEIFLNTVAPSDTSWQVQLPFAKVLDQFTNLHVRADQERHLVVPQVETPFLKVAVEDSSEFGTPIEPLEMNPGPLPSVRVEPPTAQAFAAAEPEAAANANFKMAPVKSPNGKMPAAPARIPFKLSPNGTDAPAPESVPASSGPSVPNLSAPLASVALRNGATESGENVAPSQKPGSAMPMTTPPVRIPFKMIASPVADEEAKPKLEPWLTKESLAAENAPAEPVPVSETPGQTEIKIALPLLPILKSLPPLQLTGDPSCVPPDVRLELPFALIEPQLASGRVAVTAKVFEVSLPVSFRGLFQQGAGAVDVSLPLQEVLKNLPAASLRMRDDQEEQDAGQNFATPFSAKAEEDAKRFNVPAAPVSKPVVPDDTAAPSASDSVESESAAPETKAAERGVAEVSSAPREKAVNPETASAEISSQRPLRTPLQVALDTDEKLDAKTVVALVNKIAGVKACSILFGDGLSLAGSLPAELETDGLCAMAPALMQRVENHLVDTKLGLLRGMTLSCGKGAITFYMHENLCLAALHAEHDLPDETREKLSRIVHELSRKYSHPV